MNNNLYEKHMIHVLKLLLRKTTILQEYLSILQLLDDLVIIIAVKDTPGYAISNEIDAQLHDLGLNCSLKDRHWCGYIAVIDSGVNIFEDIGKVNQAVTGSLSLDLNYKLNLKSAPLNAGNLVEIKIDGIDYASKKRGLNIVVFDKVKKYVVDSVCFDTHMKSLECFRVENNRSIEKNNKQIKTLTGQDAKIADLVGVRNRLKIENILPQKELEKLNEIRTIGANTIIEKENVITKRIEVRIFYWGAANLWNSLRTIAIQFNNDPTYHLVVILEYLGGTVFRGKEKIVKDDGLEYINSQEYNEKEDNIDIFITNRIDVKSFYMDRVPFKVAIPVSLISGNLHSPKEDADIIASKSKLFDYIFLERIIYNQLKINNVLQNNIVEMGHPKFDCIYEKLHITSELPGTWIKIKGKKVILWTTDHLWDTNNVVFDLYIKDILNYFSQKEDMALIIRPHMVYVVELINAGVWTEDSYALLKEYCNNRENIIWDDTGDYSLSYSLADGVLADTNCGITVSAMVLDKPLGVMQRYDNDVCIPQYPELIENLYKINSIEKCIQFFEMVYRGEDPMKDQRHSMFDKYICNFDGKNGLRIKEIIEQKYNEKLC